MLSIGTICGLKTEFEEIVESFSMPSNYGSDINTLEWFVENGHRSNSLRSGYERAKEIAVIITEDYYGAKETGAWVSS
jgi:hypothetical protein